jgi:single-strand DNA-binding protein
MNEKIEIKGTIETIMEIQEFSSGFRKQTLVVDTGGKYPQKVAIEFAKDKIELLANLQEKQEIAVSVNIRGNEYNGKYYVSLSGWRVDAGEMQEDDSEDIPY